MLEKQNSFPRTKKLIIFCCYDEEYVGDAMLYNTHPYTHFIHLNFIGKVRNSIIDQSVPV